MNTHTPEELGFINRLKEPLPFRECKILIYISEHTRYSTHECIWKPYRGKLSDSLLGTAHIIDEMNPNNTVAWSAWKDENEEFIYYKIIE